MTKKPRLIFGDSIRSGDGHHYVILRNLPPGKNEYFIDNEKVTEDEFKVRTANIMGRR